MADYVPSPAAVETMARERRRHRLSERDGSTLSGYVTSTCTCGMWQEGGRDPGAARGRWEQHVESYVLVALMEATATEPCATCGTVDGYYTKGAGPNPRVLPCPDHASPRSLAVRECERAGLLGVWNADAVERHGDAVVRLLRELPPSPTEREEP
jgi:hypothetical protein